MVDAGSGSSMRKTSWVLVTNQAQVKLTSISGRRVTPEFGLVVVRHLPPWSSRKPLSAVVAVVKRSGEYDSCPFMLQIVAGKDVAGSIRLEGWNTERLGWMARLKSGCGY